MKAMKVLSILTIIIGFSQCGSLKFETNPPFEIMSATYQNWSGGQPGVGGTNVKINYTSTSEMVFDSVYFNNKVTKLEFKQANSNKLVVGFFNRIRVKNEIVLDKNPTKELNNPVPNLQKFPFELNENEAVVSYKLNGKIKYFKISNLEKEQVMNFPSPAKQ